MGARSFTRITVAQLCEHDTVRHADGDGVTYWQILEVAEVIPHRFDILARQCDEDSMILSDREVYLGVGAHPSEEFTRVNY